MNSPILISAGKCACVCTCTECERACKQRTQEAEECSTSQDIFCSRTIPVLLGTSALESGWLAFPFQVAGERKNSRALPYQALAMTRRSSCWDIGKSLKHWLWTWLNCNRPVPSQPLWRSCLLGRLGCSAVLGRVFKFAVCQTKNWEHVGALATLVHSWDSLFIALSVKQFLSLPATTRTAHLYWASCDDLSSGRYLIVAVVAWSSQ